MQCRNALKWAVASCLMLPVGSAYGQPQSYATASGQTQVQSTTTTASGASIYGAQQGRGIEYGGHLVVPVWLTEDLINNPGIGFQGRVGWEFAGGFTAELIVGFMTNGLPSDV